MAVKGASIKFISYQETIPKILELMKLSYEIKKYDKIIIKPHLSEDSELSTPIQLVEATIKFCLQHKNPITEILIAEGAEGIPTEDLFESLGYKKLAENYNISLIDLNNTETEEIVSPDFIKFETISYPKILLNSFIISLSKAAEHDEPLISASLTNMLGAFPASHYKGFFSKDKNKIRKWPIKYSLHDILRVKIPDFAIIDHSSQGTIMAGLPLELDKQAAKALGKDWRNIPYIKLLDEAFSAEKKE